METVAEIPSPHLGYVDKLRVLLACGIAILLMRTVGWYVARPLDAELAVTLTESGRGILAMWPPLLALTVVSAAIGTAIVGRRLPEAGILAAGVGLTALALRSNSMRMVLGYCAETDAADRQALMMSMALDTLLWAAMMTLSWVVVVFVRHWLWPAPSPTGDADTARDSRKKGATSAPATVRPKPGWYALAITGVIGAVVIWQTIARSPVAEIARGQVIASVAGGLFLGAMAARYITGVEDARWYALAALGVALVGYLLGYLNAGMGWAEGNSFQPYAELAITPPHSLARPLPIEYIAVGISGALLGFWSGRRIEDAAREEPG